MTVNFRIRLTYIYVVSFRAHVFAAILNVISLLTRYRHLSQIKDKSTCDLHLYIYYMPSI